MIFGPLIFYLIGLFKKNHLHEQFRYNIFDYKFYDI